MEELDLEKMLWTFRQSGFERGESMILGHFGTGTDRFWQCSECGRPAIRRVKPSYCQCGGSQFRGSKLHGDSDQFQLV